MRGLRFWLALAAIAATGISAVHGQDGGSAAAPDPASSDAGSSDAGSSDAGSSDAPAGILPIPEYAGTFRERAFLLGDLRGPRADLADRGVQFLVDWTQHLQGVVDGGRNETTRYGGSLDYLLNLDLDKMGVMPGGLLTLRGESRYGNSVNGQVRLGLPVNTDSYFPLASSDDLAFALTEATYTQYLSATVAVFGGKLNTLGGDPNEFASGRGIFQFANSDFVFNPVTGLAVPYASLGVGGLWAASPNVTLIATLMNTADSSTTTGFDDFGNGWTAAIEAQFRYTLGSLPGGQNLGALYADDGDYFQFTGRFGFDPSIGLIPPTASDTYSVYWSGWQYIWAAEDDATPVDPNNGIPDRRGFGVFGRAGFGDDDTLPIEWHLSGGVGGRGLLPGRPDDHFGLAYSYNSLVESRFTALVEDESHGFEAFYNAALTGSARLTFSAQVHDDFDPTTDTAFLLGARLNVRF